MLPHGQLPAQQLVAACVVAIGAGMGVGGGGGEAGQGAGLL